MENKVLRWLIFVIIVTIGSAINVFVLKGSVGVYTLGFFFGMLAETVMICTVSRK